MENTTLVIRSRIICAALLTATSLLSFPAQADTLWNWTYSGTGITASGTFTTSDAADASGFHQITAITGSRNGDLITGLFPTGSAIPGNEPYVLDNLVRIGPQNQLTGEGFGFSLASGKHVNPFFADFLSPPGYLEVLTSPQGFSELPITFSATPVPEPQAGALVLAGLAAAMMMVSMSGVAARKHR